MMIRAVVASRSHQHAIRFSHVKKRLERPEEVIWRLRVVGRNPVGARVRTLQRGSARELGPWHEIVGVVTDLWTFPADWSGAAYIYRAASAAELDPVVVAVR
jgi:hypothetical protein